MPASGDLDHEADDARSSTTSVHDDDVADFAEPIALGVEDGAPGQARGENPLCAHASQRSARVPRAPCGLRSRAGHGRAWENSRMSMLNRPVSSTETGEVVTSSRDYESAQKTVSKLIAGEVPARDIAIVGQSVRTIERVTGKLGYAAAARSGAINGVLLGLFLSAILVLGNPEVPIQLFVGFVFIGVAVGMLMSLVTYAIVRRRRDFASVTQFAADHYEVTVMASSLSKARQVLGAANPAPVRPPVNLDEPPRYGERVPADAPAPAPVPEPVQEPVVPPRPADPVTPPEDGAVQPQTSGSVDESDAVTRPDSPQDETR